MCTIEETALDPTGYGKKKHKQISVAKHIVARGIPSSRRFIYDWASCCIHLGICIQSFVFGYEPCTVICKNLIALDTAIKIFILIKFLRACFQLKLLLHSTYIAKDTWLSQTKLGNWSLIFFSSVYKQGSVRTEKFGWESNKKESQCLLTEALLWKKAHCALCNTLCWMTVILSYRLISK